MLLRCSALTTGPITVLGSVGFAGRLSFSRRRINFSRNRIINFLMDVEPARRSANLPAILVLRRHRSGSRGINVRIVQNDDRIFSAKFQLQAFYGLAGGGHDIFADFAAAGKSPPCPLPRCEDNAPPTAPPGPVIRLIVPGGKPNVSSSSANFSASSASMLGGLMMQVLPTVKAGASFSTTIPSGTFQGVISATTPIGSRWR